MSDFILEMRGITKTFPGVKALQDVNLKVRRGEIHAICGENGAGKSTLMKVLSGVYPHGTYEGDIVLDGKVVDSTFFAGLNIVELDNFSIENDVTLIGAVRVNTRKHLHESRFSSSVFTTDRVDFSPTYLEIYILQGLNAGERLGDSAHFEDEVAHLQPSLVVLKGVGPPDKPHRLPGGPHFNGL